MNVLPIEKQVRVIAALTEGCSVRTTARLVDVHKESVMRLGRLVGEGCGRLHDAMMRDLQVGVCELDEQWQWIQKKQKRVRPNDPPEFGDVWLFVALDATSKAVVSYVVGKRTSENATRLACDLRARIINRPQITSDGFVAYPDAIDQAFAGDCDFAQLVKHYAPVPGNDAAHRYSPGDVVGTEKKIICGEPDEEKISTSYVERFNLTSRMHMRRYTRLTSGFSRKLSHHVAAVSLYVGWYNLVRVHETLRVTPAMALGVADHIWTIEELVLASLSAPCPAPLPTPGPQTFEGMSAARAKGEMRGWDPTRKHRPKLRLIRGGLAPRRTMS